MNAFTLTWFTLGAILIYMMAQDPNVSTWLVLQYQRLNIEMERRWLMVKLHPKAPWTKYQIHRSANRLAKILMEEHERGKTNTDV